MKSDFEIVKNNVFFDIIILLDHFLSEKNEKDIEDKADNREDENTGEQEHLLEVEAFLIRLGKSLYTKKN